MFGVGHQTNHVSRCVAKTRNVMQGSVGVDHVVSEDDQIVVFHSGNGVAVCDVAAVTVFEGDGDELTGLKASRPGGVDIFHPKRLVSSNELPVVVADEAAG